MYFRVYSIVVPYELYELYDWGRVPEIYGSFITDMELYGTIGILHFAGQSVVVVDSSACSTHHVTTLASLDQLRT